MKTQPRPRPLPPPPPRPAPQPVAARPQGGRPAATPNRPPAAQTPPPSGQTPPAAAKPAQAPAAEPLKKSSTPAAPGPAKPENSPAFCANPAVQAHSGKSGYASEAPAASQPEARPTPTPAPQAPTANPLKTGQFSESDGVGAVKAHGGNSDFMRAGGPKDELHAGRQGDSTVHATTNYKKPSPTSANPPAAANPAAPTPPQGKPSDLEGRVRNLGPGDKIVQGAGGFVGFGGGEVGANTSTEIAASDKLGRDGKPESYTVTTGKGMNAGPTADGSVNLGPVGVGAEGKALVGAGGKTEYTAKTPEDAARIAQILGKQNPITDPKMQMIQGPGEVRTREEQAFLDKHLTAREFSLKADGSAEAKAALGVSAGAGGELTGRVEYTDGKPSAVVVRQTVGANGGAGLNARGEKPGKGDKSDSAHVPVAGLSGGRTAEMETRIPVGPGFDEKAFERNPLSQAQHLQTSKAESKLTLSSKQSGGALGNGVSETRSTSAKGNPQQLAQTFGQVVAGDPQAMERLSAQTSVEQKVVRTRTSGVSVGGEVGIAGVGVGGSYTDVTEDNETVPQPAPAPASGSSHGAPAGAPLSAPAYGGDDGE
jgi:hypothetical protein